MQMKLKAALLVLTLEYFVELSVIKLIQLARGVKESNPHFVVRYFSLFLDVTCHEADSLIFIARYSLSRAYERNTLYIHFILVLVAPSLPLVKG